MTDRQPRRVQCKRGQSKPTPDTILVRRPYRYGNPFPVKVHGQQKAVELHAAWIINPASQPIRCGNVTYKPTTLRAAPNRPGRARSGLRLRSRPGVPRRHPAQAGEPMTARQPRALCAVCFRQPRAAGLKCADCAVPAPKPTNRQRVADLPQDLSNYTLTNFGIELTAAEREALEGGT